MKNKNLKQFLGFSTLTLAMLGVTACSQTVSNTDAFVQSQVNQMSSSVKHMEQVTKESIDNLKNTFDKSFDKVNDTFVKTKESVNQTTQQYVKYHCVNNKTLEVSYVFVNGKPMTASTKLNSKPVGVLEFDHKQSNNDRTVLNYKKTNLILDPSFNFKKVKTDVPIMLTKDNAQTTEILAKHCQIKEVH